MTARRTLLSALAAAVGEALIRTAIATAALMCGMHAAPFLIWLGVV